MQHMQPQQINAQSLIKDTEKMSRAEAVSKILIGRWFSAALLYEINVAFILLCDPVQMNGLDCVWLYKKFGSGC